MNHGIRSCAIALLVLLSLAGCGTVESPSGAASPSVDPVAVEAARAELDRALEQLRGIHPDPFHAVDESAFTADLEALKADLATMTPDQAMVGLMRLVGRGYR